MVSTSGPPLGLEGRAFLRVDPGTAVRFPALLFAEWAVCASGDLAALHFLPPGRWLTSSSATPFARH